MPPSRDTATPRLGPVAMGTLVTASGAGTLASYTGHLQQQLAGRGEVSEELARWWQAPGLAGAPYWVLRNRVGQAWLRIIEDRECVAPTPLRHTGWLALEICVADVDALAQQLRDSPFRLIGAPADLDVSDKIRAMQVVGSAGEVLYLTQIRGEAPPFQLPRARCEVDSLFIPVLCCHHRQRSLAFYESLAASAGLSFDTRITVVNRAYGYAADSRHPLATLQLAGNTLIEIDQIDAARRSAVAGGRIGGGIGIVSFMFDDLDALPPELALRPLAMAAAPYNGRRAVCLRGDAGEVIELIENTAAQFQH